MNEIPHPELSNGPSLCRAARLIQNLLVPSLGYWDRVNKVFDRIIQVCQVRAGFEALTNLVFMEPTMGTLCSKRVDKLEIMFVWAFQAYSTALYDFKWVFCKKKILVVPHIFQNFKPTIRGRY